MEAIQQPDNFRGTEGYQAPELSRGPCWSTAADVFGVPSRRGSGGERYEMGREAFEAWALRRRRVEAAIARV